MAKEEGIVVSIAPDGMASVLTTRSGACESCSSRSMCHAVGGGGNENEVIVVNEANALPGDRIVISFKTGSLLKATFLLYVFPILCLLVGAFIGQAYAPDFQMDPSALSAIVGFLFFGAALLFVRLRGNQLATKEAYRPKIIRIIRRPKEGETPSCAQGRSS
jgi:sigma-E factor negative regulatory protein RseC